MDYKEEALKKIRKHADLGEIEAIEFCIKENIDKAKYLEALFKIMNEALGEQHQIQAAKKLYKLTTALDMDSGNYYSGIK